MNRNDTLSRLFLVLTASVLCLLVITKSNTLSRIIGGSGTEGSIKDILATYADLTAKRDISYGRLSLVIYQLSSPIMASLFFSRKLLLISLLPMLVLIYQLNENIAAALSGNFALKQTPLFFCLEVYLIIYAVAVPVYAIKKSITLRIEK